MLTLSIPLQCFELIAWRRAKEVESLGRMDLRKLALRDDRVGSKPPGRLALEQCPCVQGDVAGSAARQSTLAAKLGGKGVLKTTESRHECIGSIGLVDLSAKGCRAMCAEGRSEQAPVGLEQMLRFEFDRLYQKGKASLHGQSATLVADAAASTS